MYFLSKRSLIFSIFTGLLMNANAQSLNTGETWPNLRFGHILNYNKPQMELSDFRGKAIIIDLWAHSCHPCLEAFPRLDSLQAQFKDRLQIIMINPETKDSTINFFRRMKKVYVPKNIPMVTGETELFTKLNQLGNLWLDSALTLRYSGETHQTTAANIQKFLANVPVTFRQTRTVPDLNTNVPLIAEGEGRWLDSINFYSYLFHHEFHLAALENSIPGKNGPPNRLCLPNVLVLQLYQAAFNKGAIESYNIIPTEVRVKDSSLFFPPTGPLADENWSIKHEYTYDIKVPLSRVSTMYTIMQRDLEMHFGLKAKIQLLEKECWILEPSNNSLFISTGGKASTSRGKPTKDSIDRFTNWPADKLFRILKEYLLIFSPLPVVNRLSYSGPMNFQIHQSALLPGNIALLKDAMRKNGISLRKGKAKIPVLVITD